MARVPVKVFSEDGFQTPPRIFLEDEEYARALQANVGVAVDIIAINRKSKLFYLAMRKLKPASGWWWFGGRQLPGQRPEMAAVHVMKRETGLRLSPDSFEEVVVAQYMLKDREQKPQNMGCHASSIIFIVELNEADILSVSSNLDPKEYDPAFGLQSFNREGLVEIGAREPVLALYDEVFSETNETLRRLAKEDGVSVEELIGRLAKREDTKRHEEQYAFEDGPRRKRCGKPTCAEIDERPTEPYELGN